MSAAPVAVESWVGSRFDLQCRFTRSRGKANQMAYTLDPFSIDVESEVRRGTDFAIVAWLRTIGDGLGVAGATGTLTIYRRGSEIDGSPYILPPDTGRGVGWMSVVGPGDDITARGTYRWELRAVAPDGGQAMTTGVFRLE